MVFLGSCGKTKNVITNDLTNGISEEAQETINSLVFSSLEYFPVDLKTLFSPSNLAELQTKIKDNGQIAGQCLMMPFMMNFGTVHVEGTGKWYLYSSNRILEVKSPAKAILTKYDHENIPTQSSTSTVNGEAVYDYTKITLWLDENKKIVFDHIYPLFSLIQKAVNSQNGYTTVEAGDRIGYTDQNSALDFLMEDYEVDNGFSDSVASSDSRGEYQVCPLSYYTSDLQTQITNYYNSIVYTKMKEGGKWPQPSLSGSPNINVDGEVWGTWWYKSGDVGSNEGFWYFFPKGIIIFLAKSKTNSETFFKDLDPYTYENLNTVCPDLTGLYNDYKGYSQAYLVLKSGDNTSGVFLREPFSSSSTSDYLKFVVDFKDTNNKYDDELKVKSFTTLAAAQADSMTKDVVTYVKDRSKGTPLPD